MEADCIAHVRKCHQCQVYGDLKHMPPMPLHTMTSPQPFSTWGIDIIRNIHPIASNGHEFILIAINYFIKWVEAASYKVLNSKKVIQFIQTNIICTYGVPHEIISDNGLHFKGEQRSYFHSSIFSTINSHPTVLRLPLKVSYLRMTDAERCLRN